MQIFIFNEDMQENVKSYPDKYVVKMPVETAQILSTVLRIKGYNGNDIYKATHLHHPCVKWCAESWDNFKYTLTLGSYISNEYSFRYHKYHKSSKIIDICFIQSVGMIKIENAPVCENHAQFVYCGPSKYLTDSIVQSYRNYFCAEKRHIAKWTKRSIPYWYK